MAKQSALMLIDAMLEEARRAGALPADRRVSEQAAIVRALVDEVERQPPSHRVLAPLQAQLGDELDRLVRLIGNGWGASRQGSPVTG